MMKQPETSAANTNTFTAAEIKKINGAKGMKNFTREMMNAFEEAGRVFEDDLTKPNASVNERRSCRKRFQFALHMCAVEHRTFTHTATVCNKRLLAAKTEMMKCLDQLESIRKMFVTFKQQKHVTLRQIREIIRQVSASASSVLEEDGSIAIRELAYENPAITSLRTLIEKTKTDYKTASRKLLHQAHFTCFTAIRLLLAYQRELETVIQDVINHAEKCRAYMEHTRRLELIEYCASAWWLGTQKDAMDDDYYHVWAVMADSRSSMMFRAEALQHDYHKSTHDAMANMAMSGGGSSGIKIVVRGAPTEKHPCPVVAAYDFDQELAETILTEDAIVSFENEHGEMWQRNSQDEASLDDKLQEHMSRSNISSRYEDRVWGGPVAAVAAADEDDDASNSQPEEDQD